MNYSEAYQPDEPNTGAIGTLGLPDLNLGNALGMAADYKATQDANALLAKQSQALLPTTNSSVVSGIANASGNSIVDKAMTYLGVNRYVYGKFDCSKFTQQVAQGVGINIGGDTASQMAFFKKSGMFGRSLKGAKPGDVLYFRSGASPSGRHTGIYIGNGMMIDNAGRHKPIAKRSIGSRTLIGVGYLSSLVRPKGDPKSSAPPPAAYGVQGATGRMDLKGTSPFGLQSAMWDALGRANSDMRAQGLGTFGISSGFRSYGEQEALKAKDPKVAEAGHSVHGTGFAADLALTKRQTDWLKANADKYGLLTNNQEPWHVQLDPKGDDE